MECLSLEYKFYFVNKDWLCIIYYLYKIVCKNKLEFIKWFGRLIVYVYLKFYMIFNNISVVIEYGSF